MKVKFFNQPYLLYVHQIAELHKKIFCIQAHILQRKTSPTSSGDIAVVNKEW